MKKTGLFCTVVVTLLLSSSFAFADSIESSEYSNNEEVKVISLEDIKEKAGNYELIINQSNQEYNYIGSWGTTLRYLENGKLSAMGYTETKQNVDDINVKVYLQQYDQSRNTWVSIDDMSNSESNLNYSRVTKTYLAPIGFKYRLYAVHKATMSGRTESVSSYSREINTY